MSNLRSNFDFSPSKDYHYQITLQSGSEFVQTRGTITLILVGTIQTVSVVFDKYVCIGKNVEEQFSIEFSDETVFQRNSIETRFIPLTNDIGEITEVKIDFQKTKSWISSPLFSSLWSFTKVTILQGDRQHQ